MRPDRLHGGHEGGAGGELGVGVDRIHIEIFNGGELSTLGVAAVRLKPPHGRRPSSKRAPSSRSRAAASRPTGIRPPIRACWNWQACDVPVRWACRTGVCHNCESGLVSGEVAYDPQPLDLPATGNLLICCSRPAGDVVVDL